MAQGSLHSRPVWKCVRRCLSIKQQIITSKFRSISVIKEMRWIVCKSADHPQIHQPLAIPKQSQKKTKNSLQKTERRCAREIQGQQGTRDSLLSENEQLSREVAILRETTKVWQHKHRQKEIKAKQKEENKKFSVTGDEVSFFSPFFIFYIYFSPQLFFFLILRLPERVAQLLLLPQPLSTWDRERESCL